MSRHITDAMEWAGKTRVYFLWKKLVFFLKFSEAEATRWNSVWMQNREKQQIRKFRCFTNSVFFRRTDQKERNTRPKSLRPKLKKKISFTFLPLSFIFPFSWPFVTFCRPFFASSTQFWMTFCRCCLQDKDKTKCQNLNEMNWKLCKSNLINLLLSIAVM